LVILVDTQADPGLYSPEMSRRGADLLCENALALVLEYIERGMDVQIGYDGSGIIEGTRGELSAALAYPAALPLNAPEGLPEIPGTRGVLILAMPRETAGNTALDRFLQNRGKEQQTELLFLYEGEEPERSAETNASFYSSKGGVHARQIRF
jgi:hypothetical protein